MYPLANFWLDLCDVGAESATPGCKYSRVQKNWNEVFFKIMEEPSIVQKKMIPHIKGLDFSQR